MAHAYGHPRCVPQGATRNVPCVVGEAGLLVIDVQEYCSRPLRGCHASTGREDAPYFFDRVDRVMVPNIARLLSVVRRVGVEVLFTVIEALTLDGRDTSLDYKLSGPLLVPKGHGDAAVLKEVAPTLDEILIPKTSCSVFCSTNVDYVLRNLGVRYLLVCGQLTNQCVESAVRDAADHGYLVTLVEDACAANSAEEHASALHNLKGFARIIRTEELVAELGEQWVPPPPRSPSAPSSRAVGVLRVADDARYGQRATQMAREMFCGIGVEHFELVELDVRAGRLPSTTDAFESYLILGSPCSITVDVKREPWLEDLLVYVRRLHAAQRPLVGICFGHQVIATALGGAVITNPAGLQASCLCRPATEAARTELRLAPDVSSVSLFYHHYDAVVVLPPGADSWGYGASGHWGISYGSRCLSTQAHPEFSTPTGQQSLREILEYERELAPLKESPSLVTPWNKMDFDTALAALAKPTDHRAVAESFARALGLLEG